VICIAGAGVEVRWKAIKMAYNGTFPGETDLADSDDGNPAEYTNDVMVCRVPHPETCTRYFMHAR
jgi:hypothetical protein